MNQYSDNEISFFKQLLLDFEIRVDGRNAMETRKYDMEQNVINNCFSSLKLIYNNSKNEILFTIKGELIKDNLEEKNDKDKNINENNSRIIINIDSMSMSSRGQNSEEYKNIKNKMESLLNKLMISKINTDSLIINKKDPKLFWRLNLDIFVFDDLRMSLFQLISIGIKNVIQNVKVPKIIIFKNEIEDKFEYDLRKNYEDLTIEDSEEKIICEIPNIYVYSIINNSLYLDPSDEELIITPSILYVSEGNKKILNIESIGDSVDPKLYFLISDTIKNINS